MASGRDLSGSTRPHRVRTPRARTTHAFDWGVHDACALVFLFLVTVLFHWPLITPNPDKRQSYPAGDFYDQFHAFAVYEHDRLWEGQVPLWNPTNFGGHPFLADVQAAVFYPPSLLVMLLSGPGPFSPLWLQVEAMAHFYMAAAFMYLFMRRLLSGQAVGVHPALSGFETRRWRRRVSNLARATSLARARSRGSQAVWVVGPLISALAFAFGGYLTGYPSQQLAILETQAWLPLILLLLDVGLAHDAVHRPRRWRSVLGAGLAWGMALLAGHSQSAMYVFYGALAYGLYRSWRSRLDWRWAAAAHATWIGLGVGLAAVHLLPAYEFMRLSVRSSLAYEELAGGLSLRDLVQYLVPGVFTHWSPVYVGVWPLFLAIMACAVGRRRGWRSDVAFWLALALVSLALSFGGKAYLYRLFYWVVPGFRLFRSQERAIYLTGFSLAVLAGCGWRWLYMDWDAGEAAQRGSLVLLGLGVASLVGIGVLWIAAADTTMRGVSGFEAEIWIWRLVTLAGLAWASWALARWGTGWTMWAGVLGVALILLDLGLANVSRNLAAGRAESRVYDGAWLGPVLEDGGLYRIANEWGLPGNAGCWLRRQDLYGASPLRLSAHKAMSDTLPHWRLWQLFGVRYVTTWEHDLPGPFASERVAMRGQEWAKDTVYAFRLQPDFPRAWVVHHARVVEDGTALATLADPAFDPFVEALLAPGAPEGFAQGTVAAPRDPASPDRGFPGVEVTRYAPERIEVRVDTLAPGWLVLGEWYYPGWRAWVDGKGQAIYRAHYGLRAVPLAAGAHTITFRFRPLTVYVGAAISVVSLAAAVSAWHLWSKR